MIKKYCPEHRGSIANACQIFNQAIHTDSSVVIQVRISSSSKINKYYQLLSVLLNCSRHEIQKDVHMGRIKRSTRQWKKTIEIGLVVGFNLVI